MTEKVMKNKILLILMVSVVLFVLSSCRYDISDPFADFTYDKEEEVIKTHKVERQDLIVNNVIFGKSIPKAKLTHYYTDVSGYFKEYAVELLSEVKAGDVIAVLDSGTLDKQFRDQTIQYEIAKLKYEKARLEYESSGKNENAMLSAKLDFEYEEVQYQELLNQYDALELKAEIDGVVTKMPADPGDFMTSKSAVFEITDESEIFISFDSSEASGLRLGDVLEINVRNSTEVIPAEIIQITGTEVVMIPERIHDSFNKTGTLVYVNILEDMRLGALVIDEDSVITEAGRNYVFVIENGIKSERDVKLGISDSGLVEVLFGLEEGELVVSDPM